MQGYARFSGFTRGLTRFTIDLDYYEEQNLDFSFHILPQRRPGFTAGASLLMDRALHASQRCGPPEGLFLARLRVEMPGMICRLRWPRGPVRVIAGIHGSIVQWQNVRLLTG